MRKLSQQIGAVASLTLRGWIRGRYFLVLLVLFLLFLSVHRGAATENPGVDVARFLDHGYTGLSVLLVLGAALCAVSFRRDEEAPWTTTRSLQQVVGGGAWFAGRALATLGFLTLLGFCMATIVAVHYLARFGDADGVLRPLLNIESSGDFESSRRPVFVREVGDEVGFDFDVPPSGGEGSRVLEGRFAPKLSILQEGGETRSTYPIELRFQDLDDPAQAQSLKLAIQRGKPKRWHLDWRGEERPKRLRVFVKKIHPEYMIRVYRDDLQLFGAERSFFAGLFEGALMAALFAALLALLVQTVAWFASGNLALLFGFALIVLSVSFGVLEVGLHRHVSPAVRIAALETLELVVPDFSRFDPAAFLSRGEAIALRDLVTLTLRFAVGLGLGGAIFEFLLRRGAVMR